MSEIFILKGEYISLKFTEQFLRTSYYRGWPIKVTSLWSERKQEQTLFKDLRQ